MNDLVNLVHLVQKWSEEFWTDTAIILGEIRKSEAGKMRWGEFVYPIFLENKKMDAELDACTVPRRLKKGERVKVRKSAKDETGSGLHGIIELPLVSFDLDQSI